MQLVPSHDGKGYYVLGLDGHVFAFGDARSYGQPAGTGLMTLDLNIVTI